MAGKRLAWKLNAPGFPIHYYTIGAPPLPRHATTMLKSERNVSEARAVIIQTHTPF